MHIKIRIAAIEKKNILFLDKWKKRILKVYNLLLNFGISIYSNFDIFLFFFDKNKKNLRKVFLLVIKKISSFKDSSPFS